LVAELIAWLPDQPLHHVFLLPRAAPSDTLLEQTAEERGRSVRVWHRKLTGEGASACRE